MCPPPRGTGRGKEGWGLAAWGSAPASPSKGGGLFCPASLLLLGWVGGWWHPGVGGLPELGVVARRGALGRVLGRGAVPCPGCWKRGVPVGRHAPALPAPVSLPALQMGRGSSGCLPGCCLPLPRLGSTGSGSPSLQGGVCTWALLGALCLSLPSGCCHSCLYPFLLLCPPHCRPCLVTPFPMPCTPCRALSPPSPPALAWGYCPSLLPAAAVTLSDAQRRSHPHHCPWSCLGSPPPPATFLPPPPQPWAEEGFTGAVVSPPPLVSPGVF